MLNIEVAAPQFVEILWWTGDHQVLIHLWPSETTELAFVHSIVLDKLAMIYKAVKYH